MHDRFLCVFTKKNSADRELSKEVLVNREGTKFVPWNELSEELYLDGHPDGYMIMCATYEPQKLGPFILSLSTETEFTLAALGEWKQEKFIELSA